jgi:hypothetical protein
VAFRDAISARTTGVERGEGDPGMLSAQRSLAEASPLCSLAAPDAMSPGDFHLGRERWLAVLVESLEPRPPVARWFGQEESVELATRLTAPGSRRQPERSIDNHVHEIVRTLA